MAANLIYRADGTNDASQIAGSKNISGSARGAVRDAHLLVTAHFVRTGRVGGAEHMLYNLINGLTTRTRQVSVLCSHRDDLDHSFVAVLEQSTGASLVQAGGRGSRFVAEQRACLDRQINGDAILFSNYFVPPVLPKRLGKVTFVLHDMQYRHFPQYFSMHKRAWLYAAQSFALRRADKMIVISEFGRQDAIRWFGGTAARKLTVIPNPISWERFGPATDTNPLDRPYILSVAAQYPHKNLDVLVRAFAEVCRRNRDILLVLCGQDYSGLTGVARREARLGQLINELGISDRVMATGYVDDLTLGRWYRHAVGFAFPSIFEGFGMPAAEALGFGLPALLTKCTAMPETSLGLGIFVDDPMNVSEWASRLQSMARNSNGFRLAPTDAAMVRAHYHPERIAALYLDACLS
jgi:glycosyltransferase involved in cell wall biosynthesis